jgi:hypothetical protein
VWSLDITSSHLRVEFYLAVVQSLRIMDLPLSQKHTLGLSLVYHNPLCLNGLNSRIGKEERGAATTKVTGKQEAKGNSHSKEQCQEEGSSKEFCIDCSPVQARL